MELRAVMNNNIFEHQRQKTNDLFGYISPDKHFKEKNVRKKIKISFSIN